jgi:tetratricopeptide (TPR) repeat protein
MAESHALLGATLLALGRTADARSALAEAYRISPSPPLLRKLRDLAAATGPAATGPAASKLTLVAASAPETPSGSAPGEASAAACLALAAGWHLAEAEACFGARLRAGPDDAATLAAWGAFLVATGGPRRLPDALAALAMASSLAPADPAPAVLACTVLRELGKPRDAEACLERAARTTDHPAAHHNLGVLKAELGKAAEAGMAFERERALGGHRRDL